ncbi:MAG: hypothetical protein J5507_02135 [Clostridia bacterium]|nr:hypothetical protein [Clostridia bacterium]
MRKEKGITLIALIITIIVMLILVAVTISVALNRGIFNNATDAKTQTNLAKEKEVLQTTALGYLDSNGYVDLAEFVSEENPLEGYTLANNTTYVTASNGTNTFYITKQGGITDVEPETSNEFSFTIGDIFALNPTYTEGMIIFPLSNLVTDNDMLESIINSRKSSTISAGFNYFENVTNNGNLNDISSTYNIDESMPETIKNSFVLFNYSSEEIEMILLMVVFDNSDEVNSWLTNSNWNNYNNLTFTIPY